jgi:hypothetical protein
LGTRKSWNKTEGLQDRNFQTNLKEVTQNGNELWRAVSRYALIVDRSYLSDYARSLRVHAKPLAASFCDSPMVVR